MNSFGSSAEYQPEPEPKFITVTIFAQCDLIISRSSSDVKVPNYYHTCVSLHRDT